MILYYVRHGDPIYNPDSLTELGQKQAEALSKRMCLYGLDELYASTSVRAQMTAAPTAKALGREVKVLDWMHEEYAMRDMGVYRDDGVYTWAFFMPKYKALFNSPKVRALGSKWYEYEEFPEKFGKGITRVDEALDAWMLSLGYRHDRENCRYEVVNPNEKRVGVFAHQGFGMLFLSSLLDVPFNLFSTRYDLSHSSVTAIYFREEDGFVYPQVLQHANDSHLYKEGLLTGYNNQLDV
jgi:probable phosphoglycerate mutase